MALQQQYPTSALRWAAICGRDEHASSSFIYAVRTTGIYCRPDCRARLARRANILFFDTPQEAIQAGFRACKRCRPDAPQHKSNDAIQQQVAQAFGIVSDAAERREKPSLDNLARSTGVSKFHLQREFKRLLGMTPRQMSDALILGVPDARTIDRPYQSEKQVQTATVSEYTTTAPSTQSPGSDDAALLQFMSPCIDAEALGLDAGCLAQPLRPPIDPRLCTIDEQWSMSIYEVRTQQPTGPTADSVLFDLFPELGLQHVRDRGFASFL